jgi:hypothetical protein
MDNTCLWMACVACVACVKGEIQNRRIEGEGLGGFVILSGFCRRTCSFFRERGGFYGQV